MPSITRKIGDYAFAFSGASSVELSNITIIGYYAFENSSIKKIDIPDSVMFMGDGAFAYCYSLSKVTIGSGITNISARAFMYDSSLKEIYIPENVTTISMKAFANSGLVKVVFAEDANLITIGEGSFAATSISEIKFRICL